MTVKECGSHHSHSSLSSKKAGFVILAIIFVILLTIFLVWASLRPTNPRFTLEDATVYNFNVSGKPPNLFNSIFQTTISSRNPNDNIGIYYDSMNVYASYMNQQITLPNSIPQLYQGNNEVNVWSPMIGGNSVPVAPENALQLDEDHKAGRIMLMLHLYGQIRWKVGTFITGRYHLHVRCPAYINFGEKSAGVIVGNNAVKYTLTTTCTVNT